MKRFLKIEPTNGDTNRTKLIIRGSRVIVCHQYSSARMEHWNLTCRRKLSSGAMLWYIWCTKYTMQFLVKIYIWGIEIEKKTCCEVRIFFIWFYICEKSQSLLFQGFIFSPSLMFATFHKIWKIDRYFIHDIRLLKQN